MGRLNNFNLDEFREATCFIETGTQNGVGLGHAHVNGAFWELHSVEINEGYYRAACAKTAHAPNIHLWHGSSFDKLPEMMKEVSGHRSCLFWLDAHIPEDTAEYPFRTEDEEIVFPLEKELELIVNTRDTRNDYFIIDDLRIYIEGPFQYPFNSHPEAASYKKQYPNYFPHKDGISFVEN